jgi:hypothetical protein
MTHRRSKEQLALREQRKAAYTYIHSTSYNDKILVEQVSTVNMTNVIHHLTVTYGSPEPQTIPYVEEGLVLSDSLGRGAYQ